MLIDTHTHIYHPRFDEDREAVVERAREAGVAYLFLSAIDVPSIHQALELCERYEGVYAMSALHPSETREATEADFEAVASLCDHPRVVAVGESGLDYYWDRSFDERQHDFFRRHIRLAIEKDLPLILHNREASEDLVRILHEERQVPVPSIADAFSLGCVRIDTSCASATRRSFPVSCEACFDRPGAHCTDLSAAVQAASSGEVPWECRRSSCMARKPRW
jgi:TatD family hydrolase